nr:MAG TPA: hypothetical protein [Caudoviricetes sp.]
MLICINKNIDKTIERKYYIDIKFINIVDVD